MDENPYKSPEDRQSSHKATREVAWSGFLWATIGFAAGTGVIGPFILSIEPRDRVIGGMIFGGLPLAIVGLLYGLGRVRSNK